MNSISMSQLCCPVCWEAFKTEQSAPLVRDNNSVKLPKQLPLNVVEQMVKLFENRLRGELRRMMVNTNPPLTAAKEQGWCSAMNKSNSTVTNSTSGGPGQKFRTDGMAGIEFLEQR